MSDPEPETGMDDTATSPASPDDEAAVVHGRDQEQHPDDGDVFDEPPLSAPDAYAEQTVTEEELDQVVAGVDPDDVDHTGHDESDLVIEPMTGATVPEGLAELPDPDESVPVS